MRIKTVVAAISGFVLFVSPGFGRAPDAGSPLTWDACVGMALRGNPDLNSSKYSLEANRAAYYESYNGFYPQVNLSHGYSDSENSSSGANWQTRGSVNLNLFNMSQIAGFKSSRASLYQAEANLRKTSSSLRYNLRRAFNQLLFVQKNIEVSKTILKMREDEAQLVALRYDSGKESKGNMLRAKAQFLQAQADMSQSLRDLRTAQRVLGQQLGLDVFTEISISGTLDIQEPPAFPKDEKQLLSRRPDIILQEAAVKNAEAGLIQSKSSLWPSLNANYSKSGSGTGEFSSLQTSWGLTLNYPLFGGGPTSVYYAVSAAKNNLEKVLQDLRSVRDQAIVEIETSWSNFLGAADQSKVQSALLESSRQRYEEANIRYESGLMSYDNWEIIASDRVSQERQAVQAKLNAVNSEAAWQKSLGMLLEE